MIRAAGDVARSLSVALAPAIAATFIAIERPEAPAAAWAIGAAMIASLVLVLWMRGSLGRRLRTVSSVLAALREGDYATRARRKAGDAVLDEVIDELNVLADTLREQRLGELEAWALLRKVMSEVDVVVLAFDDAGRVKLANEAAAKLLHATSSALLGRTAASLALADLLSGEAPRVVKDEGPLAGAWELRRGTFRLSGEPHALVVLADVGFALREEEREAWKKLIRVMGHEINNSLAPIQSISSNLIQLLARPERASDLDEDLNSGLTVIERRAGALGRFTTAYGELARLPPPKLERVEVASWVGRAAKLEQRLGVTVSPGPEVTLLGDADQLDQLLINLLKNAVEATLEAKGEGVRMRWSIEERVLTLVVEDDGAGVSSATSLFVPFFTTKQGGSGIGLALARQIAEAHGGELTLGTRVTGSGAEAVVKLPVRR